MVGGVITAVEAALRFLAGRGLPEFLDSNSMACLGLLCVCSACHLSLRRYLPFISTLLAPHKLIHMRTLSTHCSTIHVYSTTKTKATNGVRQLCVHLYDIRSTQYPTKGRMVKHILIRKATETAIKGRVPFPDIHYQSLLGLPVNLLLLRCSSPNSGNCPSSSGMPPTRTNGNHGGTKTWSGGRFCDNTVTT